MAAESPRPEFIKNFSEIQEGDISFYKEDPSELLDIDAPFSKVFGLKKLGIHHNVLKPGRRSSWPHCESSEEEFVYVISGKPDVWINGNIYPLKPGDAVGFPSGTGISHTFINNTDEDVQILTVGESNKENNKLFYPLNPERLERLADRAWTNPPPQNFGPHDGLPDALRKSRQK